MNDASIAHTRWNCQYHIVFIPKYRKKVIFNDVRRDLGQILRKLCEMKEVTIISAATQPDHVHMLVSIPARLSVSDFMGYLKGKSTLMLYDRHPELVHKGYAAKFLGAWILRVYSRKRKRGNREGVYPKPRRE